ncbi:MAG TPA: hypothetical protein VK694_08085 [Verrucomicrobiae bacterium]|nr:hypothetical protein [Verrucomicrobiae bacterium]
MKHVGIVLIAVMLGIAATACEPAAAGQAHQDKAAIFFSDSVWDWSMGPVHQEWMKQGITVVDSTHEGWGLTFSPGVDVPGQTVRQEWSDRVSSTFGLMDLSKNPELVVNFGINDCNAQHGVMTTYGADIANFLSAVPASVRVNFVKVRHMTGAEVVNCAETVNSLWTTALAGRPNSEIWDYPTEFNSTTHPEWFKDEFHLSTAGAQHLATWSLPLVKN